MSKLNKREATALAKLIKLAITNKPCPSTTSLKKLVERGAIRVERYIHVHGGTSTSCRIVYILIGEHEGKHTAKPSWLTEDAFPREVLDSRASEVLTELGLVKPGETTLGHETNRPITLYEPTWEVEADNGRPDVLVDINMGF